MALWRLHLKYLLVTTPVAGAARRAHGLGENSGRDSCELCVVRVLFTLYSRSV